MNAKPVDGAGLFPGTRGKHDQRKDRGDDSSGDQALGAQLNPQVAPQFRIVQEKRAEVGHITSPLAIRL